MNQKKQNLINNLENLTESEIRMATKPKATLNTQISEKKNIEFEENHVHALELAFQMPANYKEKENYQKCEKNANENNSHLLEFEQASHSLSDTIKRLKTQIKQKKDRTINKIENDETEKNLNENKEYSKPFELSPNIQNVVNSQNKHQNTLKDFSHDVENFNQNSFETKNENFNLHTKQINEKNKEINDSFRNYEELIENSALTTTCLNENHNLLNSMISPKFAENSKEFNLSLNSLNCPLHKEEISLFCIEDKSLCCTSCLFPNKLHKNHKILTISKASKLITEESRLINTHLFKKSQNLIENELTKAQINMTLLNSRLESYIKQMKENFDCLYKNLRIREEMLIDELQNGYKQKNNELDTRISNLVFLKSKFCEKFDENQSFDEEDITKNIGFLQFYQEFSKHISNLSKDTIMKELDNITMIDFNENQKLKLIEAINNYGKIIKNHHNKSPTKTKDNNILIISKPLKKEQSTPKSLNKSFIKIQQSPNNKQVNLTQLSESPLKKQLNEKTLDQNYANTQKKNSFHCSKSPIKRMQSERKSTTNLRFSLENKGLFFDSTILKKELRIPKVMLCLLPEDLLPKNDQKDNVYSKLLYRLSRDGAGSLTFHLKCDGKNPIVGLIQAGKSIFGFFSDTPFKQIEELAVFDGECWLFSIRNKLGFHPMKFQRKKDCFSFIQRKESPVFGRNDLYIK